MYVGFRRVMFPFGQDALVTQDPDVRLPPPDVSLVFGRTQRIVNLAQPVSMPGVFVKHRSVNTNFGRRVASGWYRTGVVTIRFSTIVSRHFEDFLSAKCNNLRQRPFSAQCFL